MPSNNTGFEAGRLFGRYPDRLAHLNTPDRLSEPKIGTPWALDNGVFGAFTSGREWSEEPLYSFLDAYSNHVIDLKTTAENLAWWIGEKVKTKLNTLYAVEVFETPTTSVFVEL